MKKFRIKVEELENGFKHILNLTGYTQDMNNTLSKIKESIFEENNNWLQSKIKNDFIDNIIQETDDDLIDFKSKGNDINKKEYLENEIFFEII